jgi:hypothetical protein
MDVVKDKIRDGTPEYGVVQVAELRVSRRGKHHALVSGILEQLEKLADGSALVVPLVSVGKMSLANLRSAVARATRSRGVGIKTYSDEANFYVWKKRKRELKPTKQH